MDATSGTQVGRVSLQHCDVILM